MQFVFANYQNDLMLRLFEHTFRVRLWSNTSAESPRIILASFNFNLPGS